MGKKADFINAMPVGSSWSASCAHPPRLPIDMGVRTVERHRSKDMQFRRETGGSSFIDYPKRDDILDITNGGKTITIKYKADGEIWSIVVYTKVENNAPTS